MEVSISKQDGLDALLSVKLNQEDYREDYQKLITNYRKNMTVPGFRKGKVPAGMVAKMVGKDAKREVVEYAMQKGIDDYIREQDLKMLLRPLAEYAPDDINWQGDEFEFTYNVGLRPEVKIDIDSLNKLERYKIELSDKELEEEMENLRNRQSQVIELDSLDAADDARALILFTELDEEGRPLEGGFNKRIIVEKEEAPAKLVEYLKGKEKGFDEKVKIADIFTVDEMAELLDLQEAAAKDLGEEFDLKIIAYNRLEPAEFNQEFFDKTLGEGAVSSEEDFRTEWKKQVESYFNEQAMNLLAGELKDKLMEETALNMPDNFLNKYMLLSYEANSPEDIENYEDKKKEFIEQLRWMAITDTLVDQQNIQVNREEVQAYTADYLAQSFMQMGYPSLGQDFMMKYAEDYLKKEDNLTRMTISCRDGKVFDYLLTAVTPKDNVVSRDEFLETRKNQ